MGFNTTGHSLFEVAADAIHWAEVDCRRFATARVLPDEEVLGVSVGVGSETLYRVRVGRVKEWLRNGPRT